VAGISPGKGRGVRPLEQIGITKHESSLTAAAQAQSQRIEPTVVVSCPGCGSPREIAARTNRRNQELLRAYGATFWFMWKRLSGS
jgi:hypothetical protein